MAFVAFFDGFAHVGGGHVVEEDDIDGAPQDGHEEGELAEGVDLDLEEAEPAREPASGFHRPLVDSEGPHGVVGDGGEVVVLDEDGVVESEAVAVAPAAADGVFLEVAEAGGLFCGCRRRGLASRPRRHRRTGWCGWRRRRGGRGG